MQIAVSTWSLRSHVNRDFQLSGFGSFVMENFGVQAVELCQTHFQRQDAWYLEEIVKDLSRSESRVVNMPIDSGDVSHSDPKRRAHDIEVVKGWMKAAAYLGCPSVRVNTGSAGHTPGTERSGMEAVIKVFKELAEFAKVLGLRVVIENHGGISKDPATIIEIIQATGADNLRACPDFGNFDPDVRYDGIKMLAPYAQLAHAKTLDFDEDGNMPHFDFGRCLQIMKDSGFDGVLSVEFEGQGDQKDGTRRTVELIRAGWE